jgi:hypothetical protein
LAGFSYNSAMALLENQSVRLAWTFENLLTSDGQTLHIRFSAAGWRLDAPADRKLFAETFPPHDASPGSDAIRRHFEPALAAAARPSVGSRNADHWLSSQGQAEMSHALRQAADAVAFGCGMSIGHPLEIEIDSPTLRRRQLDQAQREHARQSAAARLQNTEQTVALLNQFEALRQSAPQLNPAQILQQFAPLDQGHTLQALLRGDASKKPATLWIASGTELLKVTLPNGSASVEPETPSPQTVTRPAQAGPVPLRSISPAQLNGRPTLLLGAQNSITQWDPSSPEQSVDYRDDAAPWQMGFNSAVILGDTLWAAHGEAGLVGWSISQPQPPIHTLRPDDLQRQTGASSSRPGHLTKLNEDCALLSLGSSLLLLTTDGAITSPLPPSAGDDSPIVAILDEHETIAILQGDGRLTRLDRSTLAVADRVHPTGPILAAAALPWMGGVRLLLATRQGPIHCLGRDDPLVTQYLGPYRGLPLLAAGAGWIAGVSPDRQKLILWQSWDDSRPAADRPITPLTRHRVSDLAVL